MAFPNQNFSHLLIIFMIVKSTDLIIKIFNFFNMNLEELYFYPKKAIVFVILELAIKVYGLKLTIYFFLK